MIPAIRKNRFKKQPKLSKPSMHAVFSVPARFCKLKEAVESLSPGQAVRITSTDSGFVQDVKGWCESTGNQCLEVTTAAGQYQATIAKTASGASTLHHINGGRRQNDCCFQQRF